MRFRSIRVRSYPTNIYVPSVRFTLVEKIAITRLEALVGLLARCGADSHWRAAGVNVFPHFPINFPTINFFPLSTNNINPQVANYRF